MQWNGQGLKCKTTGGRFRTHITCQQTGLAITTITIVIMRTIVIKMTISKVTFFNTDDNNFRSFLAQG